MGNTTPTTPRQLLLSGVEDVPEVGRNLQNHPGVDLQFSTDDADSLTSQLHLLGRAKLAADRAVRRKGLGTTNFFETGAFLKTRDDVDFPNIQYEFLPLGHQQTGSPCRASSSGWTCPVPRVEAR